MISNCSFIDETQKDPFLSSYTPSKRALDVLMRGKILSGEEKPQDLLERVIRTIFSVESEFGTQPGR